MAKAKVPAILPNLLPSVQASSPKLYANAKLTFCIPAATDQRFILFSKQTKQNAQKLCGLLANIVFSQPYLSDGRAIAMVVIRLFVCPYMHIRL